MKWQTSWTRWIKYSRKIRYVVLESTLLPEIGTKSIWKHFNVPPLSTDSRWTMIIATVSSKEQHSYFEGKPINFYYLEINQEYCLNNRTISHIYFLIIRYFIALIFYVNNLSYFPLFEYLMPCTVNNRVHCFMQRRVRWVENKNQTYAWNSAFF